ncbi:MAG: hypothetical protein ACYTGH_06965 [Planctomycetota bacterium]|jgi:hypothetical protein
MFEHSRDARLLERVKEYVGDGGRKSSQAMRALLVREGKGDKSLLTQFASQVAVRSDGIYRRKGDPVDGYRTGFITDPYAYRLQVVYWLKAYKDAGFSKLVGPKVQSVYPTGGKATVTLLALEEKDQDFLVRLESARGMDCYAFKLNGFSSSGKQTLKTGMKGKGGTMNVGRFIGKNALTYPIKSDGEVGLNLIALQTYQSPYLAPMTTLSAEGALLMPETGLNFMKSVQLHLMPRDKVQPITLSVQAVVHRTRAKLFTATFFDAKGTLITKIQLLPKEDGGARSVTLDPETSPLPWKIVTRGMGGVTIKGKENWLIASPTAKAAKAIAAASGKK